ncbi:hypothetical protein D6T64_21565 [Cryobacterium melibiosiphilum]|uniref:Uncharacterized protein n=1 Tax=Cryobacterium melibiosiphilum TaxID=995039 RepID=A0A3A5MGQ5_9MICO|nr:hypothetical protein [Cryobacterium melibiosiphilum]RJT84736.1 hypothetical protein D6T64_21565 [Cryobacterium melibiosiphilum]
MPPVEPAPGMPDLPTNPFNPSAVAHAEAEADVAAAEDRYIENLDAASEDSALGMLTQTAQGVVNVGAAVSTGSASLAVTFSDVEAMTTSISSLNTFLVPVIASVVRLVTDPDITDSLILSPVTGINAEAAVLGAVTRLSVDLVVSTGLAHVTASVVRTYELADGTLSASAAALAAGAGFGGAYLSGSAGVLGAHVQGAFGWWGTVIAGGAKTGVALLEEHAAIDRMMTVLGVGAAVAVGSGILASTQEGADALLGAVRETVGDYAADPRMLATLALPGGLTLLGARVGAAFPRNFSLDDVWANMATNVQGALGATGPYFDDILTMIIRDGRTLGLFHDGQAHLVTGDDVPISLETILLRGEESQKDSRTDIYGQGAPPFAHDGSGRIIPTDTASMMASLAQIDQIGGEDMGVIRVFTLLDAQGVPTGYTVQSTSTATFAPVAGTVPNDLTSDLYALTYGDQTAMAQAVYAAMDTAGITTGAGGLPVTLDGFSLGGITAGAIAQNTSNGYNIVGVNTAGSPIGDMAIPSHIDVFSLEADEDLIPSSDGKPNPDTTNWTTLLQPGHKLESEETAPIMDPATVHNADRYGVMALANPAVHAAGGLNVPVGGSVQVDDYYAVRK